MLWHTLLWHTLLWHTLLRHTWLWYTAAVLACLLGMATKEVMVTAPLMVLLYDRLFLAGSFAAAWRRRWGLYVGLAAGWVLLVFLVGSTGLIARQPEMGAPDAWSYARTQPGVILYYLRLAMWPEPLCFDYRWPVAGTLGEIVPAAVVVALLVAVTCWGLLRKSTWSLLGAWFFLILAPTSSFMPLGQLAFEHRMYLPLAAVVVLVTAGGYALWSKLTPLSGARASCRQDVIDTAALPRCRALVPWTPPLLLCGVVLVGLGVATVTRNRDYRSAIALYEDTIAKSPQNAVAHNNLALALIELGDARGAIEHCRAALRLWPDYAEALTNLGVAMAKSGNVDEAMQEAIEHYHQALRIKPNLATAHNNLGVALTDLGRTDEAIEQLQQALVRKPGFAKAHNNLGKALQAAGKLEEARGQYQEALRMNPEYVEARNNLGTVLVALGRNAEATEQYREALRVNPNLAAAHHNLANALAAAGRTEEAVTHYRQALRIKPTSAVHCDFANMLTKEGKTEEAIAHYHEALRLNPRFAQAHQNLGAYFLQLGKADEAVDHFRAVLRLKPADSDAHHNLLVALATLVQRQPDSPAALNDLARLLATIEKGQGGNPAQAVALAQRACQAAKQKDPRCLDTLAAAYAAAGRFDEAVSTAQQAIALAESAAEAALALEIRSRLELYRNGQPYREAPATKQPDRPAKPARPL